MGKLQEIVGLFREESVERLAYLFGHILLQVFLTYIIHPYERY